MRVALVSPYAWDAPGGVQSHIAGLARALNSRGHQVRVMAPLLGARAEASDVEVCGRAIGIPMNGSVAPISFGPVAARRVRRALKDFEPDVVHLHEPLVPSVSMLALWSRAAPAIATFHAAGDASALYRAFAPLLNRWVRRLTRRIAVSTAAQSLISTYFPGDYDIIPNGVDFDFFANAEPAHLGDEQKILFLGRLEKRKGLDRLIQAMAALGSSALLVVAGEGPERKRCENLARSMHVNARFIGSVSDHQKAALYRAADVYCAPNLRGESFGIVLVEAMAAGAPVVCSDLPGFREAAGDAALYARPGDPESLASGIRALTSDPDLAQQTRTAGIKRAQGYDWGRIAPQIEACYQSV